MGIDDWGNQLCYADARSGMAYVYDDYGRMLAYTADEEGNKELVKSIQVMDDGTGNGQTIYEDKSTVDDENGLPIYYTDGKVVTKDETWITDDSTGPLWKSRINRCGTYHHTSSLWRLHPSGGAGTI